MGKEKVAIIGMGHFGMHLSLYLTEQGIEVLGVDISEDRVELVRDQIAHTVIMDTTDLKALRQLGLEDFDCVVVAIGENFKASLLTTANLQEIKVKRIINRVLSTVHERILKLMNITEMILPEGEAARLLARKLSMKGVVEHFDVSDEYAISEFAVPKWAIGKTLAELDLRRKYQLNLITILHETKQETSILEQGKWANKKVLGIPSADHRCVEEDIFVVFGKNIDVQNFLE